MYFATTTEFYATAFRKKIYASIKDLQADLDTWLVHYNNQRTHSGRFCYGKTPIDTFSQSKHLAKLKELDNYDLTLLDAA